MLGLLGRRSLQLGGLRGNAVGVAVRCKAPNACVRRGLAEEASGAKPVVTHSPPRDKAPLLTRLAWFTSGVALTLGLGMYQVGQDASDAVLKLESELTKIRDETVKTQSVLRTRIAKLEAELGKKARDAGTA